MKRFYFLNKIFWLFMALSASAVVFNSCDDNNESDNSSRTTDTGIWINGIRWATRNVDDAGTFAPTPESFGKLYQWNRRVAWSATEPGEGIPIPNWDDTTPTDTEWTEIEYPPCPPEQVCPTSEFDLIAEWTKSNDPCPTGWRVPTNEDLHSLLDLDKVKLERITTGVPGIMFTDMITGNKLFFPAHGIRLWDNGALYRAGDYYGQYWSSNGYNNSDYNYSGGFPNSSAFRFIVNQEYPYMNNTYQAYGLSIRCVEE